LQKTFFYNTASVSIR